MDFIFSYNFVNDLYIDEYDYIGDEFGLVLSLVIVGIMILVWVVWGFKKE